MTRTYRIRIKGHLDHGWSDWFSGLTMVDESNGETVLVGPLPDQSALHALLNRVRDLGISLISVNLVDDTQSTSLDADW